MTIRSCARAFELCCKLRPIIVIAGEAGDGREAIEKVRQTKPSVVVMDLALPILNGVDATREILNQFPATPILMLSTYSHDESVTNAVQAGAVGYVLKQTATNELVEAIRSIHRGARFFSASIARRLHNRFPQGIEPGRRPGIPAPLPPGKAKSSSSSPMVFQTRKSAPNSASASKPLRSTASRS